MSIAMENWYLLGKKTIEFPASYATLLEGNGFFQVLLKHVDFEMNLHRFFPSLTPIPNDHVWLKPFQPMFWAPKDACCFSKMVAIYDDFSQSPGKSYGPWGKSCISWHYYHELCIYH